MAKGAKKNGGKPAGKEAEEPPPDEPAEDPATTLARASEELAEARKKRNKAQVEHEALRSYYEAAKEQIRELDMRLEQKDLEIENAEEDCAAELRVYEQKASYIKYCHDSKLESKRDDNEQRVKEAVADHGSQGVKLKKANIDMRSSLTSTKEQHTHSVQHLQEDAKTDLASLKEKLDADVNKFEQQCIQQQAQLEQELESRRTAQLELIETRKESHLKDLRESHERRCADMKKYFDVVERQEDINIEDLEAEIKRLKKAALHHQARSSELEESNQRGGEELRACSEEAARLEAGTKTKDKDAQSLSAAAARLRAAQGAVRETGARYARLREAFAAAEEELAGWRSGIAEATADVCQADWAKHDVLTGDLELTSEHNALVERHLHHIMGSAGRQDQISDLQSSFDDFIQDNDRELEKLHLQIAKATACYHKSLRECHSELLGHGVSKVEADAIDALEE